MASAIVEFRRGARQFAVGVGWMLAGAPFSLLPPGPLWRPRPAPPDDSGKPLEDAA
jgi:hypothetical protein